MRGLSLRQAFDEHVPALANEQVYCVLRGRVSAKSIETAGASAY